MTDGPVPPPRRRASPLARYGPVSLVVAAIVVVGALATTAPDDAATVAAGPSTTTAPDPTENPDLPITYAEAREAGTVDDYDWGDGCDPDTGRIRVPSVYAAPCLPVFSGDNGGATSPGVTADTVKVVVYVSRGTDLASALQGVSDDPVVQGRTLVKIVEMMSALEQTYGRKVELVPFETTANGDDEAAAIADAIEVAEEIRPFASIGGPSLTAVYADELAKRGVLCLGCGISSPDSKFQENAPYMWGNTPPPEQYLLNLGDYVSKRLVGGVAEFAGGEQQDQPRVFGVVHFEQDPPVFDAVQDIVDERAEGTGYEAAVTETYVLDIPRLAERAATIIARLKDAGVTSVIFLGDPLMPTYLTKEATAQGYFPEWIVTGTVLTDTTVFGRRYDPAQWEHAFGISALPARLPRQQQGAYAMYEWYYGEPPEASNTIEVIAPSVMQLMLGIHMAGPNLTPETFQGGLWRYPPSGGGPTKPRISYGDRGVFERPDYNGIDDAVEIWWDPTAVGPDEQGNEGTGMWRYSDGGERYLPGEMPDDEPHAFQVEGSVTMYDEVPPQDRTPDYPSPGPGG